MTKYGDRRQNQNQNQKHNQNSNQASAAAHTAQIRSKAESSKLRDSEIPYGGVTINYELIKW